MVKHARASYSIVRVENDMVFVEDRDIGVSITNDAEAVVSDLVNERHIGNRRIIYKDTMGNWDELLHNGDVFTGFAPYRK